MKYLLYYNLDSKFKSDQVSVSGDGTSVVSVVDGVAWTEDAENVYYRYRNPDSENLTSYTITIHYKDINGDVIAPDDVITVDGYSGYGVSETIIAKSISGYTVISDDAKTFIIDGNIEHTFTYVGPLEETPLAFHILSSGTITWVTSNTALTKTIEYKKNGGEWTSITSNTGASASSIDVNAGDVVQFRGDNATYGSSFSSHNSFSSSTPELRFKAYGNIMSLINSTDFKKLKTFTSAYAFTGLFSGCTSLVEADKLLLPATTLANRCYYSMFLGCTSLEQAPELPARELADRCYQYMFQDCSSLATAPELPATTLVDGCYYAMFSGCTSLIQAPKLPATTLESDCYTYMFYGCKSLTTAPELPATSLTIDCYMYMFTRCRSLTTAPELPATIMTEGCYSSMFAGCTSLIHAPELPATKMAKGCYAGMFESCSSLTTAPELPATTLANYCYSSMFGGCTSLIHAPSVLPARTLASSCYTFMFNDCISLTTAPELPATTLVGGCYYQMFYDCTNLNYIKAMFTTRPETSYSAPTYAWLSGVASGGTFVANSTATWTSSIYRDPSTVPEGWTIINATS